MFNDVENVVFSKHTTCTEWRSMINVTGWFGDVLIYPSSKLEGVTFNSHLANSK